MSMLTKPMAANKEAMVAVRYSKWANFRDEIKAILTYDKWDTNQQSKDRRRIIFHIELETNNHNSTQK